MVYFEIVILKIRFSYNKQLFAWAENYSNKNKQTCNYCLHLRFLAYISKVVN